MTKSKQTAIQIGDKIRLYRTTNKGTRRWLGSKLEKPVSHQQIGHYETGKQNISASSLYHISKILKTSINKFFPK